MTEQPPLRTEQRPYNTREIAEWCAEEIAQLGTPGVIDVNNTEQRMTYVHLAATVGIFTELLAIHRTIARAAHQAQTARHPDSPLPPEQRRSGR